MDIVIISPESEYEGETELVEKFFRFGLKRYHLRKPNWSVEHCQRYLDRLPSSLWPKISIHQHHQLASDYAVGLHFRDDASGHSTHPANPDAYAGTRSRSLHSIERIGENLNGFDYALVSPIFPSFSKPGHRASWTEEAIRRVLDSEYKSRIYGLGGMSLAGAALAKGFGFQGIALHSAVWRAKDPLSTYKEIREEAS